MFSFPDAARFLEAPLRLPDPSQLLQGASLDTRTLTPGNLFVALAGARSDGHEFLEEAFRKGASGALIREDYLAVQRDKLEGPSPPFRNLIPVSDPQEAFAKLAAHYRTLFKSLKVVGITGSVGKSSTKEFLSYILSRTHAVRAVLASEGNQNNHLGLPLTLFRLRPSHQFLVAELGANHVGEIASLARILKPEVAILTRIAPAHLEGFGSLAAVYRAKLELVHVLPRRGVVVTSEGDPSLMKKAQRYPVKWVTVGSSADADYHLSNVSVKNNHVHFHFHKRAFAFPGAAGFLAQNAALALAMASEMGVSPSSLPRVWSDFKPPRGRFELRQTSAGIRFIDDGYNANPESFKKALETFSEMKTCGKKILVFADMLELGGKEKFYHEALGSQIAASGLDKALAYGPRSRVAIERIQTENSEIEARHFTDARALAAHLRPELQFGDILLFKASRGMKIEEVWKGLPGATFATPIPKESHALFSSRT